MNNQSYALIPQYEPQSGGLTERVIRFWKVGTGSDDAILLKQETLLKFVELPREFTSDPQSLAVRMQEGKEYLKNSNL